MVYENLIKKLTSFFRFKLSLNSHSDPVILNGKVIDQRIKGTPGITGWCLLRVLIEGVGWHLDVGSSHPDAEEGIKGPAVRRLKWYVSWV